MSYEGLIERLKAATGPDRELDIDVHLAFGLAEEGALTWGPYLRRVSLAKSVDAYTRSIDVARALAKRAVPEANCIGFDETPSGVDAYVGLNNVAEGHWMVEGWHETSVPIAIVIATLTAKETDNAD